MINISKFGINKSKKSLIIAEIGQSHDGSLKKIKNIINKVSTTGADIIKFQTHYAEAESTPKEPFRVKINGFKTRMEYWKKMEFSLKEWKIIKKYCEKKKLVFLSSPFSEKAVDVLQKIGVCAWKIGSGEFFSDSLLKKIIKTRKPIILSTGLAKNTEIRKKIIFLKASKIKFIIMQCTSMYPCPLKHTGINYMKYLKNEYKCLVGFSDHSGTIYSSIAAMCNGASIVEVHVETKNNNKNPDTTSSISIKDLKELCKARDQIHIINYSKFSKDYTSNKISNIKKIFTKSCVLKYNKKKNHILKKEDIVFKKPGYGIPEAKVSFLIGKKLKKSISKNVLLNKHHII